MQHRDGHDEGQVEPVRDVDVLFAALEQRSHEHDKVGHPDDGQPQIDIPFRLGIFLGLRGAEDVAGRRQHDEEVVAPEHEPGEAAAPQPRRRGALHHVERRHQQRVAAKGEDHRRGVQRPQLAEVQVAFGETEVQVGKGKLEGDERAHQKSDDTPERCRDDAGANHAVIVFVDRHRPGLVHLPEHPQKRHCGCQHDSQRVDHVGQITRVIGCDRGQHRDSTKRDQLDVIPHSLRPFAFPGRRLMPAAVFLTVVLLGWGRARCLDLCQVPGLAGLMRIKAPQTGTG